MHLYRALIIFAALLIAPCAFAQVPSQIPAGSGGGGLVPGKGIYGGISGSIASGATDYIANGISTGIISVRGSAEMVAPYAGTASNLTCSFATGSATAGPTITVGVNGVNSALTMTCATGATTCTTALQATFTSGQTLDIQVNNVANTNATGIITCSFQLS